ncbi:MAG TPA: hypothetical protein VK277_05090 [Acidimicrobiales bacterium]|nr:hypothetical protein [Acidimicrobiales bacterium]
MTPQRTPSSSHVVTEVDHRPSPRRTSVRLRSLALAAGVAVALAPALAFTPASSAAVHASKTPVVVKQANRKGFGHILVTKPGATLYDLPSGTCTGGCLQVWPPLVLPAGDTTPKGGKGVVGTLGTMPAPGGGLQVTYNGLPLYTFVNDSGHSVNGNNVAGFHVVTP